MPTAAAPDAELTEAETLLLQQFIASELERQERATEQLCMLEENQVTLAVHSAAVLEAIRLASSEVAAMRRSRERLRGHGTGLVGPPGAFSPAGLLGQQGSPGGLFGEQPLDSPGGFFGPQDMPSPAGLLGGQRENKGLFSDTPGSTRSVGPFGSGLADPPRGSAIDTHGFAVCPSGLQPTQRSSAPAAGRW
eukprot:TRINITY_DN27194_c0_g1_i1.p1 TRINITY_DN27194_c0_g1~~TRINITY_DN27194_c0_g1_i1.p1  ORF type:complete len:216 (+),score=73.17 TRINITY_DN27194_c0_g1_i1:75-650(+)